MLNFLDILKKQGLSGDATNDYADRLMMSTDNSIYQFLTDAVLFPRNNADTVLIASVVAKPRFTALTFTPRVVLVPTDNR